MKETKNNSVFDHVQRYVRENHVERLRNAGFVSYHSEDINWFRLVNGEVVHAIYFQTSSRGFPIVLEVGYGCHSLFIPPILHKGPHFHPSAGYEQVYHSIPEIIPGSMPTGIQRSLMQGTTNTIYRIPDVLVMCPESSVQRESVLEQVLAELEKCPTTRACYDAHKRWRHSQIENESWLTMTPYFVDEVLYWEDRGAYPYCREYVEKRLQWLCGAENDGYAIRESEKEHLQLLKKVFDDDLRLMYLDTLHKRAQQNLKLLNKHTSIGSFIL